MLLFGVLIYFPFFVLIYNEVPYLNLTHRIYDYMSSFAFWGTAIIATAVVVLPYYVYQIWWKLFNPTLAMKLEGNGRIHWEEEPEKATGPRNERINTRRAS